MADATEKLHTIERREQEEQTQGPEIKETGAVAKEASDVVGPGVEAGEGSEQAEFSEGKVSETAGEDKKKSSGGAFKAAQAADEVEIIRARLLQNLPTKRVMVREIKRTLQRQEVVLEKQYKKLRRKGHKEAYRLNGVVAQMRHVREFFSKLADATFEIIKQLWLKIVHNV
jgi:hypothetical protein